MTTFKYLAFTHELNYSFLCFKVIYTMKDFKRVYCKVVGLQQWARCYKHSFLSVILIFLSFLLLVKTTYNGAVKCWKLFYKGQVENPNIFSISCISLCDKSLVRISFALDQSISAYALICSNSFFFFFSSLLTINY